LARPSEQRAEFSAHFFVHAADGQPGLRRQHITFEIEMRGKPLTK
jgi:hypothetical protein